MTANQDERRDRARDDGEAFNRRDYEQVTEHATEDVEVLPPPRAPEAKVYREARRLPRS